MSFIDEIKYRLNQYKKKYYLNILLKGAIFFIAAFVTLFLGLNLLEYIGRFDSITRATMFFSFISISIYGLYYWVLTPIYQLINLNSILSDEEAAKQLGNYFPEIKDKLLNIIQLNNNDKDNSLILASINQKYSEIKLVNFSQAVEIDRNKKFAIKYLILPILLLSVIGLIRPKIILNSAERIVAYDKQFLIEAPFEFKIKNENLNVIYNESFTLDIEITGEKIPKEIYLYRQSRKVACEQVDETHFTFTFNKVYKQEKFYLEGAGYTSSIFALNLVAKPKISGLNISLEYPKYLNRTNTNVANNGNLTVPEGTRITWKIETESTDHCELHFDKGNVSPKASNGKFLFDSSFVQNTSYDLTLNNAYAQETSQFNIQVIKDQYPTIRTNQIQDSMYYEYIYFNGVINDDYGFSSLNIFYKKNTENKYKRLPIKFNRKNLNQSFNYKIPLDSIDILPGEGLTYFVEVRDNDRVNNPKSARSSKYSFQLPTKDNIDAEIDKNELKTAENVKNAAERVENHQKKLRELHNNIKGKKELEWKDKQELKKLLKEREDIKKDINRVNKEFQENQFKKDKFQEQDQELKKKADELQKLLEELKNPELEKLYKELDKLLEDPDMKELNKNLEKMELKNESLEKQLDRNLEMLKQLKFEQDLQEQINKLNELSEKQEKLAEENKNKEIGKEEAKKEQDEINKEFEDIQNKMEDIKKNNDSMENPNSFDDLKQEQSEIEKSLQNSSEKLDQGKQKQSAQDQQKAADQMKKMANKMANQQQAQQSEQAEENLQHIRLLLENLVHLSFEQEKLMLEFRGLNQKDPRFVSLSQKQIDLQDDAKIVEDSLYALAKRVFQIKAIVTQEVELMNKHMNESVVIIKKRQNRRATASQQYAMTSMNNLALLLSDVMQQMQEQMAQQMQGDQMCKKPGNKPGEKPGVSDLQKQLNQQIKDLKNGQKSGRELSEKLAELAAKQEQLRRALQELNEEGEKNGGTESGQALSNELKRLEKLMKETESDLVNKNLSQRTIQRQEQIMSRLLKAEKASKEREYDEKRKGTTAQETIRPNPPALEKYLKAKRKEVELIKTIPPDLQPYYKEKVNQYFNK